MCGTNNKGFTLVELLVATAIFGLVVSGMYGVYLSTQRTTVNQGELVDVQQDLRVVSDFMNRDIKMAGALIPAGNTGVVAGSNATTLNLSTASSLYAYARISSDLEIPASPGASTDFVFSISVPASVDYFKATDTIRIVRPQSGAQPLDTDLTVSGVDRTGPTITVNNFSTSSAIQYKAGDIMARVAAGSSPDPSTITWSLNASADLQRSRDGGTAETVGGNISSLAFSYLLENGTEILAPAAADLANIRAVKVTLTVDTARQLGRPNRQRSLSTITYLRN